MLRAVLSLLHKLIVFGYYADPQDVMRLMEPLKGDFTHTTFVDGCRHRTPACVRSGCKSSTMVQWRNARPSARVVACTCTEKSKQRPIKVALANALSMAVDTHTLFC